MTSAISRRSPGRSMLIVVASLICGLAASSAMAQDLATLAKKEKARRAKLAAPGKVLTEEDAAKRPGTVNVTELAPAPEAADTPSPQTPSADEQRTIWKARAAEVKTALASAQKDLEKAERAQAAFRSDVAPLSAADAQDPMRLQKRDIALAEMTRQIEALKAGVAAARANIAAFEDEARRAAVPPGWLR